MFQRSSRRRCAAPPCPPSRIRPSLAAGSVAAMQWSAPVHAAPISFAPPPCSYDSGNGITDVTWFSPSPDAEMQARRDEADIPGGMVEKLHLNEHHENVDMLDDEIIEISTNGANGLANGGGAHHSEENGASGEAGKMKRAQGPRGSSCSACRRGKRKCDEGRPCKRCISKGPEAAAACAKEPTNRKEHIHRPEKFRQKSIQITATNSAAFDQPIHTMIPHKMLATGLAHTTCAAEWIEIFNNLTPKLHQTAMDILDMIYEKQIALHGRTPSPLRQASPDELASSTNQKRQGAYKWAESSRCGFISLEYNPNSGMRDCVSVNKFGSVSLFGMHQEEALARLAQDELKLPTTQLRTFCLLFDGMLPGHMFRPNRYLISTGKTGGEGGVMIRSASKMEMDEGKMKGFTSTFTLLTPEEYDKAVEVQPDVGETLAAVAGRSLTGREIVESKTLMRDETFASLRSTDEGRAGLERLADCLRDKFLLPASPTSNFSPTSSAGGATARSESVDSRYSASSGGVGGG